MNQNTMTYRGYVATVEYSAEDQCFIGRIHGIRDIITFEGESVKELETDFHNAVNLYLQHCKKTGKTPEKQCSGKMLLRLPASLHYELTVQAETAGSSVNALVVEAVETLCRSKKRAATRPGSVKAKKAVQGPRIRNAR